ncbi:hypothetical protein LguiB_014029 [Lonicera macranthoides]
MATGDSFGPSHLQQFPQPSRPFMMEEEQMVDEHTLLDFFSEYLEEIDEKTCELVKKLFSKAGKEIPLERFTREEYQDCSRLSDFFEKFFEKHHSRPNGEVKEDAVCERGVDFDSIAMETKLERFKVKPGKENPSSPSPSPWWTPPRLTVAPPPQPLPGPPLGEKLQKRKRSEYRFD